MQFGIALSIISAATAAAATTQNYDEWYVRFYWQFIESASTPGISVLLSLAICKTTGLPTMHIVIINLNILIA